MEMNVLTGQTVTSVRVEFGFLFTGSAGDVLQVEQSFDRVLADGERLRFEESWELNDAILGVQSLTVRAAEYSDDKRMLITFDDGSGLELLPHPQWESWNLERSDGSSLLCTPGGLMESPADGELPTFGEALIDWATTSIAQLEAEDVEIVGLHTGELSRRPDRETQLGRQAFLAFLEMVEGVEAFMTDYTAVLWLTIGRQASQELRTDPPPFEEFLDSPDPVMHEIPRVSIVVPRFWARYEERERYSAPLGRSLGGRVPVRVHYESTRLAADSGEDQEWRRAFAVRSYLSRDEAAR